VADYGADPAKVCAMGYSSGAHLALWLSDRVRCVVDVSGPADLNLLTDTAAVGHVRRYALGLVAALPTFSADTMHQLALTAASPIEAITSGSAPVLVAQGSEDPIVPPAAGHMLVDVLEAAGVPVEVDDYKGGHAFAYLSARKQIEQMDRIARFVIRETRPQ
jgi:acetyl esterase/lipase